MSPSGSPLLVLGIEASCDETAAAVVRRHPDGRGEILSNVVRSQWEQHRPFGGVVPEIAARAHVECLDEIVADAMREAGATFADLSAVAATAGPGLAGGLIVGLVTGKTLALANDLPFVAVNHLEAHALTVGLTESVRPPYLLLLVSGGHSQILLVEDIGRYRRIGTTVDDALGEAFDKTAKLLGLPQPGGPAVERAALAGDATRFSLPRPMIGRDNANFSFAGLKTAVRHRAMTQVPLDARDVSDLCAAFQQAVTETVADRVRQGMSMVESDLARAVERILVVAGGVAANNAIRSMLDGLTAQAGWRLCLPPIRLCTDNAAMVAWAGAERFALGHTDPLDGPARPRWPLDSAAAPALGSGRLGAKA